ncbi:uncharacterized protein LOC112432289 [Tachysurus ichikawai]
MASVSLPCRNNLSVQQALAWLQEMDEAGSDGGDNSFVQQATDTSSEESEKETEQEPNMPNKHRFISIMQHLRFDDKDTRAVRPRLVTWGCSSVVERMLRISPHPENHFFFASVSLPRRKNLSAQQALAWLQEMDEADSDGGEISFVQQATDTSSEESEKETKQEPNMPNKHRFISITQHL